MPLMDPSLLPALPVVQESKTFTDEMIPGVEWPLTFRLQRGFASAIFIRDKSEQFYARFGGDEGEKIELPGGGIVPISPSLCDDIALLDLIDITEGRYTFRHWAILAERCPRVFLNICTWAMELQEKALGKSVAEVADEGISLKNDSTADGANSSVPPQSSDSTPTS